ncbi:MAG: hemolysin III family protein [Spirochaetales bacterium]|nr:hemolysin III family protein [Spirochaetales bacterium]
MFSVSTWLESHITLHSHDSEIEEKANSITHGVGAVLSAAGMILLLFKARGAGSSDITALTVFGISMILSYGSSSVYHMIKPSNWKRFLRILDHVNIYILIAGTYTPFCMTLPPDQRNRLLIIVWSIVVLGTVFKLVFWGRVKVLHTLIYLAMGWLIVFFIKDFAAVLPGRVLFWMLGGGLSYSVGTIFYASKKIPFYHAIWHVFVLAGSAFFYGAVYIFVIPLY